MRLSELVAANDGGMADPAEPAELAPRPWFEAYEAAAEERLQRGMVSSPICPFHTCFQLFADVTNEGFYGVRREDVSHFLGALGLPLLSEGHQPDLTLTQPTRLNLCHGRGHVRQGRAPPGRG